MGVHYYSLFRFVRLAANRNNAITLVNIKMSDMSFIDRQAKLPSKPFIASAARIALIAFVNRYFPFP